MNKFTRMTLSLQEVNDVEKHIDIELNKLRNKAKVLNDRIQRLIMHLMKEMLFNAESEIISMLKDEIKDSITCWNKELTKVQNSLTQYLKDFIYTLTVDSDIKKEEKEHLVKIDDKLDEFFTRYDDQDFTTYGKTNIEMFLDKLELFSYHIMEFRPWDTEYNINLFADTLKMTGKYIAERGWGVNSKKQGRKCMAAGGMLKKAYEPWEDTASEYYFSDAMSTFTPDKGSRLFVWNLTFKSKYPQRIDKMIKVSQKREQEWTSRRKKEAWHSITKTIYKGNWSHPIIDEWVD